MRSVDQQFVLEYDKIRASYMGLERIGEVANKYEMEYAIKALLKLIEILNDRLAQVEANT